MRELENKILDILIDINPKVPNMEVAKAALKIVELIKKEKNVKNQKHKKKLIEVITYEALQKDNCNVWDKDLNTQSHIEITLTIQEVRDLLTYLKRR